jgi:hypothetical protein
MRIDDTQSDSSPIEYKAEQPHIIRAQTPRESTPMETGYDVMVDERENDSQLNEPSDQGRPASTSNAGSHIFCPDKKRTPVKKPRRSGRRRSSRVGSNHYHLKARTPLHSTFNFKNIVSTELGENGLLIKVNWESSFVELDQIVGAAGQNMAKRRIIADHGPAVWEKAKKRYRLKI